MIGNGIHPREAGVTSDRDDRLQALVRRARKGGPSEFHALAEAVLERIRRWAIGLTGNRDAADEVTQRVLITLHRSLDTYAGRGRFENWLYRVTRNAALSLLREERRHAKLDENLAAEAGRHPVERLEAERTADLVRTFFRDLPTRQREVFDLVDLQGLEPSDVAEMLELQPSTVRVHLHRARKTLRKRILDQHPEIRERYGDDL